MGVGLNIIDNLKSLTAIPFLFLIFFANAQTFPVQATVQLTPPYSLNLSDYSSPESERLAFMIILADVNRPELQVKFRLRIEGQGIEITTSPAYNPPAYILQGGIPERITGFDLAAYFNPANLEFRGTTRTQYQQTAKLPEGLYRICVEVVEYNRNVVVSNTGCASAWLVLNDPPIVNVPRNAEKIRILNPQNIIFQWTPRHTGSPNAAFRTDYECTLVELWPETRNPNDAILSSPPILQETTSSTTFIYGPAETPLVAGRHYAFRVQAKSISGISELDLFKNNGYSEVITFRYGDPCLAPDPITTTVLDPERIKLEWTASAQHTEYAVQYRQAGTSQWYDQETFLPYTTLKNLKPGTTYEFQLKAICGPVESEAGKTGSATTKELEPGSLVCGTSLPIVSLDNTVLLNQLNPGDVVEAGDFSVTIKRVTGTGSFTGSGIVDVAFFKNAKVNVEFESIKVNPEYRMVEGKMEVKGVGIDVLPDRFTDLMDQLSEALALADEVQNEVSAGLGLADEILNEVGELANEFMDDGLYVEGEENFTMEQYLAEAKKAMQGARGALASAPGVGNTAQAARGVAQGATLKSRANRLKKIYDQSDTLKVIAVEFVANDPYGFDKQEHPQHRLHYNIMVTPGDASTGIPWAAMKAGEPTTVRARLIPTAGIRAENIVFRAGEIVLTANQSGNEWNVTLPAMDAGATLTVKAVDNTTGETVGKLDAVAYSPVVKKVNLVPLGTTPTSLTTSSVRDELNRIYKQAVAEWDVAILPPLEVPGYNGTLQDDEQALLSVYSDGMKEIIRAFEASGNFSKEEFYLFLADNSQTGKAGYMPRKHRYGFIYQNENTSPLQTIAHELGHGAFRLQHTFEEYPSITTATPNLMDYHNGTQLRKYQWDLIHNPPIVIGLLEDEGEGALTGMTEEQLIAWWEQLPPYKKAAEILQEHLEDTEVYENVRLTCDNSKCVILADLKIGEDITYTMEVAFLNSMTSEQLIDVLVFEYRVDLWDAFNVAAEGFWDEAYHWWRKQNDNLAQQKGWQVSTLNFLADVITAPTLYPAVSGWATGKHWRDGHDLAGWEQALAALDFLVAEEMVKGCITNFVVRVGSKTVNLLRLKEGTKYLVQKSIEKGLKFSVVANDEVTILSQEGKVVGKIVGDVLTIPYTKYGGDIVCVPQKTTTIVGRFEDMIDGGGTGEIINSGLSKSGQNIGGVNVLGENIPAGWNNQQIWDNVNEPWLRAAASRDDVIRAVSDPTLPSNIYKADGSLTFFGREHELLTKPLSQGGLGYTYNPSIFAYTK